MQDTDDTKRPLVGDELAGILVAIDSIRRHCDRADALARRLGDGGCVATAVATVRSAVDSLGSYVEAEAARR